MTVHIKIGGDPVTWTAADDRALAQVKAAAAEGATVAVDVVEPLEGRLLLCARNAGAVTALNVYPTGGWVPSHYFFTSPVAPVGGAPAPRDPAYPFAYLLGDGASDKGPFGYPLPDDTDLRAVEEAILLALSGGTTAELSVAIPSTPGTIVINGRVLAGVVLVPASPAADQSSAATGADLGEAAHTGQAQAGQAQAGQAQAGQAQAGQVGVGHAQAGQAEAGPVRPGA